LTFVNEADYDRIDQMDVLSLPGVRAKIEAQEEILTLQNETKNETYEVKLPLTERQRGMILAGGLINFIRTKG
jgi:aconitate hydratase